MRRSARSDRRFRTRQARRRCRVGGTVVLFAATALIVVSAALSIAPSSIAPSSLAAAVWGAPTQITAPGEGGSFAAISCVDATDCTAVGSDDNGQPIVASETNGTWGDIQALDTGTGAGDQAHLDGVSCADAEDCLAVGEHGDEVAGEAGYYTETNGVWGPGLTFTGATSSSIMKSISCPTVGNCVAVGEIGPGPGGPSRNAVVTMVNGTWGPIETLAGVPGSTPNDLDSVSCASVNDCVAVGQDSNDHPLYVNLYGTPAEFSGLIGGLNSVSCPEAGDCTAIGSAGVYAVESNGTWAAEGGAANFTAIGCSDQIDCTATGVTGSGVPMYATETAGAWGAETAISGFPTGTVHINGISCTSTSCTIVGYDGDTNGFTEPFYVKQRSHIDLHLSRRLNVGRLGQPSLN